MPAKERYKAGQKYLRRLEREGELTQWKKDLFLRMNAGEVGRVAQEEGEEVHKIFREVDGLVTGSTEGRQLAKGGSFPTEP